MTERLVSTTFYKKVDKRDTGHYGQRRLGWVGIYRIVSPWLAARAKSWGCLYTEPGRDKFSFSHHFHLLQVPWPLRGEFCGNHGRKAQVRVRVRVKLTVRVRVRRLWVRLGVLFITLSFLVFICLFCLLIYFCLQKDQKTPNWSPGSSLGSKFCLVSWLES